MPDTRTSSGSASGGSTTPMSSQSLFTAWQRFRRRTVPIQNDSPWFVNAVIQMSQPAARGPRRNQSAAHRRFNLRSRTTRNPFRDPAAPSRPRPAGHSRRFRALRRRFRVHRAHRSSTATCVRSPRTARPSLHDALAAATRSSPPPGVARHAASSGTSADSPSAPSTLRTEPGSWEPRVYAVTPAGLLPH